MIVSGFILATLAAKKFIDSSSKPKEENLNSNITYQALVDKSLHASPNASTKTSYQTI